jgi:NAD(P)-dependent dehydrogenase (short-subunit alcohol dehydrogenase family)
MKNYFDLTGKVAIITGASSGLGVQFAKALGEQGAKLALFARREEKLQAVQKELQDAGYEAIYEVTDVLNTDNIAESVAKVVDQYSRIDILINGAGVAVIYPAEEQPISEWDKTINTNLNGVYYVAREVGKVMVKQKYGKIINLGSIHSTVAMPGLGISAYTAAKGGVKMLTKALASEWAKYNITVNAIGPAYFESEMTQDVIGGEEFQAAVKAYCPMCRVGEPGELDGAVLYFASDASRYCTGQLLSIDGGWTAI